MCREPEGELDLSLPSVTVGEQTGHLLYREKMMVRGRGWLCGE